MKRTTKKALSLILVLVMAISLFPTSALAVSQGELTSVSLASNSFNDVSSSDWFYDAVQNAVDEGLFNGTSDTTFSPNEPMTRAMYVTVLGRMAGIDTSVYSSSAFSDVSADMYYAPYVNWASSEGIVNGTGETTFSPNDFVTRAQVAAINSRYLTTYNISLGEKTVSTLPSDFSDVPDYAEEAVTSLWQHGIFKGSDGKYFPNNNLTRAEGASSFLSLSALGASSAYIPEDIPEGYSPVFAGAGYVDAYFTINVMSNMSATQIENALILDVVSNPISEEKIVVTQNEGMYKIAPASGMWTEGYTYSVKIADGISGIQFVHEGETQPETVREYNFVVERTNKEEVANLTISPSVIEIPMDEVNGDFSEEISSLISVDGEAEAENGVFSYDGNEEIAEGDTVAIYDGAKPSERTLDTDNGNIEYLTITAISGNDYTYETASLEAVIFIPDLIPYSADMLTSEKSSELTFADEIDASIFENYDDSWALTTETVIEPGDFIVIFPEDADFADVNSVNFMDETLSYYEVMDYANGDTISVEKSSYFSFDNSMELFIEESLSADDMMDALTETYGGDLDGFKDLIIQNAIDSGFAESVAQSTANLAMQTEGYQNLMTSSSNADVEDFIDANKDEGLTDIGIGITNEGNVTANYGDIKIDLKKVSAGSSPLNADALSIELTIPVSVNIKTKGGKLGSIISIDTEFVFEQQISVDAELKGSKSGFLKYVGDFMFDLGSHTAVGVTLSASFNPHDWTGADADAIGMMKAEISEMINTTNEYFKEPIEEPESVAEDFEERYADMLENTEWVEFFRAPLAKLAMRDPTLIFEGSLEISLVSSALLNATAGITAEYTTRKQTILSFILDPLVLTPLKSGDFIELVDSNVVPIIDDGLKFSAYLMGTAGIRTGLQITTGIALGHDEAANLQTPFEYGTYLQLYGYAFYQYPSVGEKSDGGARYIESGAYMSMKLTSMLLTFKFPVVTLIDERLPLLKGGDLEYIFNFTKEESAEGAEPEMKNLDVTTGGTSIPKEFFSMSQMNLKTGEVKEVTNFNFTEDFTVESNSPNFEVYAEGSGYKVRVIEPTDDTTELSGTVTITWNDDFYMFTDEPMTSEFTVSWSKELVEEPITPEPTPTPTTSPETQPPTAQGENVAHLSNFDMALSTKGQNFVHEYNGNMYQTSMSFLYVNGDRVSDIDIAYGDGAVFYNDTFFYLDDTDDYYETYRPYRYLRSYDLATGEITIHGDILVGEPLRYYDNHLYVGNYNYDDKKLTVSKVELPSVQIVDTYVIEFNDLYVSGSFLVENDMLYFVREVTPNGTLANIYRLNLKTRQETLVVENISSLTFNITIGPEGIYFPMPMPDSNSDTNDDAIGFLPHDSTEVYRKERTSSFQPLLINLSDYIDYQYRAYVYDLFYDGGYLYFLAHSNNYETNNIDLGLYRLEHNGLTVTKVQKLTGDMGSEQYASNFLFNNVINDWAVNDFADLHLSSDGGDYYMDARGEKIEISLPFVEIYPK